MSVTSGRDTAASTASSVLTVATKPGIFRCRGITLDPPATVSVPEKPVPKNNSESALKPSNKAAARVVPPADTAFKMPMVPAHRGRPRASSPPITQPAARANPKRECRKPSVVVNDDEEEDSPSPPDVTTGKRKAAPRATKEPAKRGRGRAPKSVESSGSNQKSFGFEVSTSTATAASVAASKNAPKQHLVETPKTVEKTGVKILKNTDMEVQKAAQPAKGVGSSQDSQMSSGYVGLTSPPPAASVISSKNAPKQHPVETQKTAEKTGVKNLGTHKPAQPAPNQAKKAPVEIQRTAEKANVADKVTEKNPRVLPQKTIAPKTAVAPPKITEKVPLVVDKNVEQVAKPADHRGVVQVRPESHASRNTFLASVANSTPYADSPLAASTPYPPAAPRVSAARGAKTNELLELYAKIRQIASVRKEHADDGQPGIVGSPLGGNSKKHFEHVEKTAAELEKFLTSESRFSAVSSRGASSSVNVQPNPVPVVQLPVSRNPEVKSKIDAVMAAVSGIDEERISSALKLLGTIRADLTKADALRNRKMQELTLLIRQLD